jgi:hypothetical protein
MQDRERMRSVSQLACGDAKFSSCNFETGKQHIDSILRRMINLKLRLPSGMDADRSSVKLSIEMAVEVEVRCWSLGKGIGSWRRNS